MSLANRRHQRARIHQIHSRELSRNPCLRVVGHRTIGTNQRRRNSRLLRYRVAKPRWPPGHDNKLNIEFREAIQHLLRDV